MGITRLLFALFVLIHHSEKFFGYKYLDPALAVHSFFIISGFYMTLILKEKYIGKSKSYILFLSNRFLRIYPTYWLILLLTIGFLFGYYERQYNFYNNLVSSITPLNIIREFTIIGRTDYLQINPDKNQPLLIPQAWTLVLELLFYIVAPFIVKKLKVTFLIAFASIIVRYLVFHYALIHHIPLPNRFFPSEIIYF